MVKLLKVGGIYLENKTVFFSGHRPEKLPNEGDEYSSVINRLKSILYKEICYSVKDGYCNFMTGLARGVDSWAAEMILQIKVHNPNVKLICVKPFEEHGKNWKGYDKWRLSHALEKADEIITISTEYKKGCLKERNQYMVDNADMLIAVVENYRSGTGQTIRLANTKGLAVKVIDINEHFNFFNYDDEFDKKTLPNYNTLWK